MMNDDEEDFRILSHMVIYLIFSPSHFGSSFLFNWQKRDPIGLGTEIQLSFPHFPCAGKRRKSTLYFHTQSSNAQSNLESNLDMLRLRFVHTAHPSPSFSLKLTLHFFAKGESEER